MALNLIASHALADERASEGVLYRPYDLRSGWRKQLNALTHFNGMSCPDWLLGLERVAILPDNRHLGIGCKYESNDANLLAIFRQHNKGDALPMMATLTQNYAQSGFKALADNKLYKGITFITGHSKTSSTYESLWIFEGSTNDYSLWVAQRAPVFPQETDKILQAFFDRAKLIDTKSRQPQQ